jgi:thiol-disulfide isomerase/thioredoxin
MPEIRHLLFRRRTAAVVSVLLGVALAADRENNMPNDFPFMKSAYAEALRSALRTGQKPSLANGGAMPELDGAIGWLNSAPLQRKSLRGKVVLIDFWTYTCINSLRPLPYLKSWAAKYKDAGLVVIGVHTPEFSFEKDRKNVDDAVRSLNIGFPIAMDSDYRVWDAFDNHYWPAQYLIDGKGQIRYQHSGEGDYGDMERTIQDLLKENGATGLDSSIANPASGGVEAAPDFRNANSSETYIGYRRTERFASSERLARDSNRVYSPPLRPSLNQWALSGAWNIGAEAAVLNAAGGKIMFRFHSRDLHLVLAPGKEGKPARFKLTLDGNAPGESCGSDCAPDGTGTVRQPRLYQLIRQKNQITDRTFEIEFLDPGVRAFVFTFG